MPHTPIEQSPLILRELTSEDESAFLAGLKDWVGEDLTWYTFVWKEGISHAEHLKTLESQKDIHQIAKDRVPATMFYAFVNDQIVGRLSLRHNLNDFLMMYGGHFGYAVSPKHRKKGYATEIFRQGLDHCKKFGLHTILITCAEDNIASKKLIEKFGGVLENRVLVPDINEYRLRYWLKIKA